MQHAHENLLKMLAGYIERLEYRLNAVADMLEALPMDDRSEETAADVDSQVSAIRLLLGDKSSNKRPSQAPDET